MEKISIREFARRMKVTDRAIRVAIDVGWIKSGFDKKNEKINFEKAKEEWKARAAQAKIQKTKAAAKESNTGNKINKTITLAEATRLQKIHSAKKTELEVAVLEGSLVPKEKVYKELFQAGQEVRAGLLVVPDKVIDLILSSENRNAAHSILYAAISEALQSLHFKNVKI